MLVAFIHTQQKNAVAASLQRSAPQGEHEVVTGRHLGVGVLRSLAGIGTGDRHDAPGVAGTARLPASGSRWGRFVPGA